MSSFIKTRIKLAGENPERFAISRSQLQNQLPKYRTSEKEKLLERLMSSDSKNLIQFDTKTCSELNKRHFIISLLLFYAVKPIQSNGDETCAREIINHHAV